MDPIIENDWHGIKREPVEEVQRPGNVVQAWQWRERGIDPHNTLPNKTMLENRAEDILVKKTLNSRSCDLPGYPRSTFLMVFSPDGTKVASTHGNHNVYVSELASGKHVRILRGHPRTPWCIAFHPSHPQLIGSGCLSGQVRVWDLSGGSEVWTVRNETVIASVAFHPRDQLLVIATFNELYFWDWSQPAPFTKVCTKNINEKVRYVAFDSLGYKLITGISVWSTTGRANTVQQNSGPTSTASNSNPPRRDQPAAAPGAPGEPGDRPPAQDNDSAQEMMVNSYQNLVQRYDSLVRNYQRLFMARHHLTNTSAANTTDRGTDPMDTDASLSSRNPASRITITARVRNEDGEGTSRQPDGADSGEGGEGSGSRLLNLEVLSINSDPTRFDSEQNQGDTSQSDESPSTSRTSASQDESTPGAAGPAAAGAAAGGRRARPTRWLPNPFSVLSSIPHRYHHTVNFSAGGPGALEDNAGSSRTSVFTSHRLDSPSARFFLQRRRNALRHSVHTSTSTNTPPPPAPPAPPAPRPPSSSVATQIDPDAAQTINESLDLIRDILRDSGTRLLNLITNMSLSTLANVERSIPHERDASLAQPDETERLIRMRNPRPRVTLSPSLRRDFISSESESDNDNSLEVNLIRPSPEGAARPGDTAGDAAPPPTNRMVVNLNVNGMNVTLSDSRFRVRSLSTEERPSRESSRRESNSPNSRADRPQEDTSRPSTSRDPHWMDDPLSEPPPEPNISSSEAFRKVKKGVMALQRHTMLLSDLWVRGAPTTPCDLRYLWENLRRRALSLERLTGRTPGAPGYYTRTLMERCRFLTEMTRRSARIVVGVPASPARTRRGERGTRRSRDDLRTNRAHSAENQAAGPSTNPDEEEGMTSSRTRLWMRASGPQTSTDSTSSSAPTEGEASTPPGPRGAGAARGRRAAGGAEGRRPRADPDMTCTRHEIRMRAMQVLSIMFNMMMHCLEERGLSQLIITMLKLLKKSLALTCLMLVTNRHMRREPRASAAADTSEPTSPDETSAEGTDNGSAPLTLSDSDEDSRKRRRLTKDKTERETTTAEGEEGPSTSGTQSRWSERLAVQISAANRNTSATARTRRDTYIECKRQKALHRTNPSGNPISKRRIQPPSFTYRIPTVRLAPRRRERPAGNVHPVPRNPLRNPLARNEALTEFEHRVNLFRIAHMQAVRMRNAARSRFRRLQTIRLYSPSSVREMFALQSNNNDNNQPGPSGQAAAGGDAAGRRQFPAHRPHILAARSEPPAAAAAAAAGEREPRPFEYLLNNVAVPLAPDVPAAAAAAAAAAAEPPAHGPQPQRLPRVHEYLQPIILAQNALVTEDGPGGGGGVGLGGLLDASLASEALPASAHRVQAWDFTTGNTPEIADSTKNIVVPRCRIHNDASIDISKDGRVLVALLPVPRMRNANHWLGVYSLEWGRLGQCLFTAVLEQSAVSVALSPTARHLAVGLGSRRFTTLPHARNNVFGLIYRLAPCQSSTRGGLAPVKELEQNWEQGFTSLNCLRWAPQPGQGLVYANNTGQLILMS